MEILFLCVRWIITELIPVVLLAVPHMVIRLVLIIYSLIRRWILNRRVTYDLTTTQNDRHIKLKRRRTDL